MKQTVGDPRNVIAMLMAITLTALTSTMTGCASLGIFGDGEEARLSQGSNVPREGAMDRVRLERLFESQVEKVTGGPGSLRSMVGGYNIWLITDPLNDRMRLMVPIAQIDGVEPRFLNALLEANIHSTLDARYGVSEGTVYAVYLHPISTLDEADFTSAFQQTLNLARTLGTSFSSGKLQFGK